MSSNPVPETSGEGSRPRLRYAWSTVKAGNKRAVYAWMCTVAVFVAGGVIQHGFASGNSLKSILVVASFVGVVAAGQMCVVLVGGIDLSVPWLLNSALVALMLVTGGSDDRLAWAIPVVLAGTAAAGALNGVGIAYLGVPPVVMTLGMNGILQGVVLGRTGGFSCDACTKGAPAALSKLVHGDVLGIPGALVVWAGLAVLITVVLNFTTFGRRVYAVGLNPVASFLSLVNTRLLLVALYALSGLFSGVAGVLLLGYTGVPSIGAGDPYLFTSIAAVVVGGVAITGGRGHYLGAAAGAITLTAITTLLIAKDMPDALRSVVYGLAVLVMALLYNRSDEAA
jgi:ribose transport system permease protein